MYRNSWLPEVFNDFLNTTNMPKANPTAPAINVLESEKDYIVELAAPGLSKEDFDVNINSDGDLTIKMEKKAEESEQKAHYLRCSTLKRSWVSTGMQRNQGGMLRAN